MKSKIKLLIMIIIVAAVVCFVNITRSRYMSEMTAVGNIDAAIPIIVLNEGSLDNQLMLPGDSKTYEFYVGNKDGSDINEVKMNYYINVELTKNEIPLTYKLYEITNNGENEITKTDGKFGPFVLDYGVEQNRHFKLVIEWNENDNSVNYAGKQNTFSLKINATQVL